MTTKDLLEVILLIVSVGSTIAACSFFLVGQKYSLKLDQYALTLSELQLSIKADNLNSHQETLETVTKVQAVTNRKLQQNNDNLLVRLGVIECDVRDIKAVLQKEGVLHERAGFPQDFVPERTDWDVKDV